MRVFVTGARGTLGSEVIARLMESGHSVVGLVRSGTSVTTNDGTTLPDVPFEEGFPAPGKLTLVRGDIEKPRLGLGEDTAARLLAAADGVIHSAALTSFGRPEPRYESCNVVGTKHVLDWLASAPSPVPLVYVSTMYVCGERPGSFFEADLERGQTFGSPYEASKYRAEKLVRSAMASGQPACVVRPSIIVGESSEGKIRSFDTIYTVYRVTSAGLVRVIPGDYGATLDVVPVDWVADRVVESFVEFRRVTGATLHLCSNNPVTLRDINDVCAEFPSFNVPRFVPGHVFRAYPMRGLEKRLYEEIIDLYESYFRRQVFFSRVATCKVFPTPPPSDGKALLRTAFRHAVDVGHFRRRNDAV